LPSEQGSNADVQIGEIALQTEAGVAVLSTSGEHDLNTAPELRRRVDELIARGSSVVIDLSPASFLDSSILGAILDSRQRAIDAGLGFAVAHAGGADAVARVLEVTGLRDQLPVHESLAGAIAAAAGPTEKTVP
jgi:anti-sigma B factor antagonist